MQQSEVIIIGAGPAGLATAAHLRERGISYILLEKSGQVGQSWRDHYERLHLHTVKERSHLPFVPFPEAYPRYVSRGELVRYFEEYAEAMEIRPEFGVAVERIRRGEGGGWEVTASGGAVYSAPQVVVATGVNCKPFVPTFAGADTFSGEILHSRAYRNARPFTGRRVLVVGMGNTGAEIALDLAEHDIPVVLSVRSPVNIVPRDFLGRPTQLTALKLARLPLWLGDWIGIQVRRLSMGDLRRYGLRFPRMAPARQLRETGKTPVVDIGTAEAIRSGKIRVKPGIDRFQKDGVVFTDGDARQFDSVILATGYRAGLHDLLPDSGQLLDPYGWPKDCIGRGPHQGLYFIGFDNYTPGGILGVINRDSERIANAIREAL